ncbi:MarR family winged helix-turn-helix transcriptional regulator [Natronospora cellulosivora (SeqCode)]
MDTCKSLVKVVEKLSTMMGEFEDKALNSDELSDLSMKQLHYLDVIKKLSGPAFTDLAREMSVSKPTVTLAVNKLIKQGYVKKEQSAKDRRVYHLLLTDKGKKLVKIHDKAHKDFASLISSKVNKRELEQLVEILHKVVD